MKMMNSDLTVGSISDRLKLLYCSIRQLVRFSYAFLVFIVHVSFSLPCLSNVRPNHLKRKKINK